jgi:hypothetical protein
MIVVVEIGDGGIELNIVVVDESEVSVCCCPAPERRKGRRVNTVPIIHQFSAIGAQKRQRKQPS